MQNRGESYDVLADVVDATFADEEQYLHAIATTVSDAVIAGEKASRAVADVAAITGESPEFVCRVALEWAVNPTHQIRVPQVEK